MSWLPIIALALVTFVVAAFVFKLPKAGWTLFAAALLFGLTGYALQGNPGYAGSPKDAEAKQAEASFAMVDARREFFQRNPTPSRFVTTADAFAGKGQYETAAGMLQNAVRENPSDSEAWVALGNVLIEHADGSLTPAALYAYARANEVEPGNPAASYFLGLGFLRSGRPVEARQAWADLLESAPEDAPWRTGLAERLARLEALMQQMGDSPALGQ